MAGRRRGSPSPDGDRWRPRSDVGELPIPLFSLNVMGEAVAYFLDPRLKRRTSTVAHRQLLTGFAWSMAEDPNDNGRTVTR